jgi:AAA family ATP:ADP antiporter
MEIPASSWLQRVVRILGVERGEERLFVVATAALFLVEWAAVAATNVAETLFLKRVGVDRLPLVFLANSLLLAATGYAVGRLAARGDRRRLLVRLLAGSAVVWLVLWLPVSGDLDGAFPLLVIMAKQTDAVVALVFWATIGGLVSGRQAKRLFAPITAGGTLGGICGSFASAPIGRALGIPSLLLVAASMLALAGLTIAFGGRASERSRRAGHDRPPALVPSFRSLWDGWLFRVLVLSAFCAGVLGPMLYFQFSYVADLATKGSAGEQRLLDLYSAIRGWINVGVLAVQMIGTSALFRVIGVPVAAALSPLIYLLGLVGLCVQTSLAAGVGAMAGATLQDHAVYDPAQRILTTLFPERVRTTVATLVAGPVTRVGGVTGNAVVIGVLALSTPAWVGWIGLPVAVAWLVLAIALWRRYPSLLLEVASAGRLDARAARPPPSLVGARTLLALEESLVGPDADRCRAACALMLEAPPGRAVESLAYALTRAPRANQRLLVTTLDAILEEHSVVSHAAARTVARVLAAAHELPPLDHASLVQAYARLVGAAVDARERAVLERAAEDDREAVRLAARTALARVAEGDDVDTILLAARTSGDTPTRHIAREELRVELLRPGRDPSSGAGARLVAALAADLDSAERGHAARALADVAAQHGRRLAALTPALLALCGDADTGVRTAVLRFVGALRLEDQAPWVVGRLAAGNAEEATAAMHTLEKLGPTAIDALCDALRSGGLLARTRALVVLRDVPEAPGKLDALVAREVESGLRLMMIAGALDAGGANNVVLQRLRERIDASALAALLLLDVILDDERIGRACGLLGREVRRRDRAVLLEALEAVLPPDERARILPLIEGGDVGTSAARAGHLLHEPPPTFDEAVRELLVDGDRLTAMLLLGTMSREARGRLTSRLDGDPAAVSYDAAAMDRDIETILHLRSVDLFEHLATHQLADLARVVEEVTVSDGTAIVTEGEVDDCMYVVVDGRVRVVKGDVVLNHFSSRGFFGEMALLDGQTRSTSAIAVGAVRLLRLSRAALLQIMEEQPAIAIAMCQTLSRRVRDLLEDRARLEPRPGSRGGS